MTCNQNDCLAPAHLVTHDCFNRPLSGWEVRAVLNCLVPVLMVRTKSSKKKGLVVLPKSDMSPYIMTQATNLLSSWMPLTVLVEDEDLALRILDEEEALSGRREYSMELVRGTLEQHAKYTTGEYSACLVFDYVAEPLTTRVVPYVTKVCRPDAYVAHVSRVYGNESADNEDLVRLWDAPVRGFEEVLTMQLEQVTASLIQNYITRFRRPSVYGSFIAGSNVNSAVGALFKVSRDTSTRLRPYESYYIDNPQMMIFDTERSSAEYIQAVREDKAASWMKLMFVHKDYEEWLTQHAGRTEATPGTRMLRRYVAREASHESAGVQQLLRGTVRARSEAETGGPRSDSDTHLRARPRERR